MKFSDNITSEARYMLIKDKEQLTKTEIGEIIRYPFKSLASYCTALSNSDIRRIKEIERINILNFFNALRIVLGKGSGYEMEVFNRSLSEGPLKIALLTSRLQPNPKLQFITFVKIACKILLTRKYEKTYSLIDHVNVRIDGIMPRNVLKSRQDLGNKWFTDFVENKLFLFERLVLLRFQEDLFSILSTSFAYSIYSFNPDSYRFPEDISENDMIYLILQKFVYS